MKWLLLLAGFLYTCRAELSDFEDVFSVLTGHDKRLLKNNEQKRETNGEGKSTVMRESYEVGLPPFPPLFYDNIPNQNSEKSNLDEIFLDMRDQKENSMKQKKKPKEKVIMSFTEFFIPFMNHKSNFDFPSFPKKLDFFDSMFKNLGFKDIEEPILKITKRKLIPHKNASRVTETTSEKISDVKKSERGKNLDSLLHKPKGTEIVLVPKSPESEEPLCCGNPECKRNCHDGLCKDPSPSMMKKKKKIPEEFEEEEDYFPIRAVLKQEIKRTRKEQQEENTLDKVLRMSLLYTVPVLIGVAGAIIALEILRRDTRNKQNRFLAKEYGPIQHC